MDSGMSITVEEVDDECPPPLTKSRGGMGAMETDDQWGEEKGLMEKFLEDFDLDGILDDPRDDDDARGSVSTGPNKRGRTIKKRRKQGISPTDPRKFYTDRLVNALCSGDIEKVRVVMERYHEPDCVYIQRFTNNTPDLPAYREIHGREQMLAFYKAFLASSPDCVVKVTDRQLNVYQDGSSYLVSKMNFSGAWLFRIFFSNIVRRTRSFLNRTFFNRPTIINPFRPKKGASSSSSSSSMTSLSAMSTDSGASTARNDKESSAYMFASFRRKKSVTGAVTAAATAMMAAPTGGAPVEPLLLPDDHHHHQSLSRSTDADVASSPLSSHSHHASSSEEAPSIRYLHGDMHLVAGKASDYESDARPPTPLSPLSTVSSQPDVQPPPLSLPLPLPPLPPQLSPNASLSTSASPGLANVDADVVVEGPPEVLEAEAPWDDLPFTIVRDEAQSSTPIPAPAALIVTPESKVSVVTAQPKPYRVNIAISNVAHINPAGRIFKTEMFLKAEVSISWWAAAKNQAGTTEDLEPLPEADNDNDNDEDHDHDGFIGPNEGDEVDDLDEEDEAIHDTNGIVVDEVDGPVACLDASDASSATAVPATATTQMMNVEPFVST